MAEFPKPFDLTSEYVESEATMLEEMARELPTMAGFVKERIALLQNDPGAYYDARLAEEIHTIGMSARIMRAAGLDPGPEA